MLEHTPGPWRIWDELILHGGHDRQGKAICEAPGCFHWETEPDKLANARLIAAAPDLLEACESMIIGYNDHDLPLRTHIAKYLLEAIAKATKGE